MIPETIVHEESEILSFQPNAQLLQRLTTAAKRKKGQKQKAAFYKADDTFTL